MVQIQAYNKCRNLSYQHGMSAKAPNPYSLRLVKILSGEDGIGGGIGDVEETKSYQPPDSVPVSMGVRETKPCHERLDSTGIKDIKKRYVMLANGGLVIADPTERRLKVFDGRGIFVRSFVCRKNNYDAPLCPNMIALDTQNRIIVADGDRGVICILDISGKFIREFGIEKNGELGNIKDIHVTSQDNIIVVSGEHNNHDLTVFDSSGVCLGKTTLGDRWFFSNGRMLAGGNLYDFAKVNTKKLQTIVPEDMGDSITGTVYGFMADDKGNMYVRQGEFSAIQVYATSGKEIETIGDYHLGYEEGSMGILANGHIAVSLETNTSIWDGKDFHYFRGSLLAVAGRTAIVGSIFNMHHQPMFVFRKITAPDTVQTLFRIPGPGTVPVATDAANRIIVGDHGCVRILNPDGSIKRIITDADGQGGMFGAITAVAIDQKNRIVVADYRDDGHSEQTKHVRSFDANGVFLESNTDDEFRAKGFEHMADMLESYPKMARDSHDRVISDGGWSSIKIQDASGNDVKEISVGGTYDERIKFADALTVDRWDRIITVDRYRLTIRFFDHEGEPIRAVPGTSIGGRTLASIHGVASDGMGRIIISGRDKNGVALIQIFDPGNKPKTKTERYKPRIAERDRDPLHILKVRYAKGEITDEQFETMKKRLA